MLAYIGASPLAMLLVGIGCIAVGIVGLVILVDRDRWSEVDYVPRTEGLFVAIALFGVASIVAGVAKAF